MSASPTAKPSQAFPRCSSRPAGALRAWADLRGGGARRWRYAGRPFQRPAGTAHRPAIPAGRPGRSPRLASGNRRGVAFRLWAERHGPHRGRIAYLALYRKPTRQRGKPAAGDVVFIRPTASGPAARWLDPLRRRAVPAGGTRAEANQGFGLHSLGQAVNPPYRRTVSQPRARPAGRARWHWRTVRARCWGRSSVTATLVRSRRQPDGAPTAASARRLP